MSGAEALQNLVRVVGDGRDLYTLLFEALARLFQLDELASTIGSPIGASTKDQKKARGACEIDPQARSQVFSPRPQGRWLLRRSGL